jgi:hypothetical protein
VSDRKWSVRPNISWTSRTAPFGSSAPAKTACRPEIVIDSASTPAGRVAAAVVDVSLRRRVVELLLAPSSPPHAVNTAPALTAPRPIRPNRRNASRREMSPSAQSVAISSAT